MSAALALLLNAFVWGVSWYPFRRLEAQGLHPLWATAFIYAFALACLLAVRPQAWRGMARYPALWLLGLAAGLTNVGFNWAVTTGDVVRVVLLFYLMPAWTVLLAWLLLGERPGGAALVRLALALAGVAVVLKAPGSPWPVPRALADWLGLMGGASFALTNILLRRWSAAPAPARVLAMFGGGALMATLAALLAGGIPLPPAPQPQWLALAAGLSLAFLAGNVALQYGAARLAANTTALIMLAEVLFASGSAVLLDGAQLSARVLAGGALIVAAALWAGWQER